MSQKIYVTGQGIYSSIGENLKQTIQSLRNKKTGLGHLDVLSTVHKGDYIVGEIKKTNKELLEQLGFSESDRIPRNTILAMFAAQEAMKDAGIEDPEQYRTGIILGTTAGGMDQTELFYRRRNLNTNFIRTHNCGYTTETVADFIGVKDFATSISTACSSAANAALMGARLIKAGILDRVVVGGTDALAKFTLNGFNALMILDREYCRPFDATRMGLNLGEGAAFLVIEGEDIVNKENKIPICELSGYSNKNDAFHHTATSSDGDGPYLCMKEAMDMAGIEPSDIDYINVHGTGTGNNDQTEATALRRLFGEKIPPFSSTKGFTGHTLGAAGGLEAVFSILVIQQKMLIPNLNFKEPIDLDGFKLFPETEVTENYDVNHVLTNSFGFGANDTSLIFSKI